MDIITNLSQPAFLACISYILLAFALLLPLGALNNDKNHQHDDIPKYNLYERVLFIIIMLIPVCLSIYSINCMVVGQCHIWAWVQSIAIAIWVILFIIMLSISQYPNNDIIIEEARNKL